MTKAFSDANIFFPVLISEMNCKHKIGAEIEKLEISLHVVWRKSRGKMRAKKAKQSRYRPGVAQRVLGC